MTAFRWRYLDSQATKPLVILDLGSQDIRGSYRPIFDRPPWKYVGVDITPGKNVDLVIRDPYEWRELKANSVDVLISGQTFEHTEFFWETAEQIERVLKPNGLCCIIAPWTGPVHRYPLDCWRINGDGMLAVARYAGLEVLEAWTQIGDSPKYDLDSNQWHESILIARKPTGRRAFRQQAYRWLKRHLRPSLKNIDCWVQVFFAPDQTHREEQSVCSFLDADCWRKVWIALPTNACVRNVRIDFSGPQLRIIEIASLRVCDGMRNFLHFPVQNGWDEIQLYGDAERLESPNKLRVKTDGIDPQLHLPSLETAGEELSLFVEMQARVKCEPNQSNTSLTPRREM
jgi:SAM-dependent methyltransferase